MAIDWEDDQAPALSEANLEQWGAELVAAAGSGIELGYAQRTSDFTTTSTSLVDVTGLTTSVVVATRPIVVRFEAVLGSSVSGGIGSISLFEDGTQIATIPYAQNGGAQARVARAVRRAPSAGSHTYKAQATVTPFGSGTLTVYGDSGSPVGPSSIQVVEV